MKCMICKVKEATQKIQSKKIQIVYCDECIRAMNQIGFYGTKLDLSNSQSIQPLRDKNK